MSNVASLSLLMAILLTAVKSYFSLHFSFYKLFNI